MLGSQGSISSDKATVIIADATPMDCQLMSDAIQRDNHFRVVDRAISSSETISAVCRAQPDIALISARLQDGPVAGLLALRALRASQARSRVVLVLDNDESELVVNAFLNKARGVFCRRIGSSRELRKCLQSVHSGELWVNNSQLEYIVEALMRAPARAATSGKAATVLSRREDEIAALVATGMSNGDVANKLGLSPHTVKNVLFRIFEKLGISTRIELVLHVLSQAKPPEGKNDLLFPPGIRESA